MDKEGATGERGIFLKNGQEREVDFVVRTGLEVNEWLLGMT